MPRTKHTDARTASQGLKAYMATLLGSGILQVKAKGEAWEAMSSSARMKAYLAEFGQHFAPAVNSDSAKGGNMDLTKLTKPQLIALLANGGEVEEQDEDEAISGFVVGCTFTYTAKSTGKARRHTIQRIGKRKGGTAYTDTGKQFRVRTLESLNGSVVKIVK